MKFLLLLLPLLVLSLAIFGPLFEPGRDWPQRAQAVTRRLTILTWLSAVTLLAGLLFLPDKGRVLLTLLPLYGLLAGLQAYWRRRLSGPAPHIDLQRMKRAKPARPPAEREPR